MGNYGGCYYNLFDAHSPFQIDGNYGCTSGIAEMLLQSYDDIITLLPALPSAWKEGSVTGLKAQGNFTVDETWQDGKITSTIITSNAGQDLRIRYAKLKDAGYIFRLNGEGVAPIADGDVYSVPNVKKGDVVTIDYDNSTSIDHPHRPFGEGAGEELIKQSSTIVNLAGQQTAKGKSSKGVLVQKGKKFINK
jgi:alpha-L-fucosidase 2